MLSPLVLNHAEEAKQCLIDVFRGLEALHRVRQD